MSRDQIVSPSEYLSQLLIFIDYRLRDIVVNILQLSVQNLKTYTIVLRYHHVTRTDQSETSVCMG